MAKNKNTVVIVVEGGMVMDVLTNLTPEECDIEIFDYDNENEEGQTKFDEQIKDMEEKEELQSIFE